MSMNDSTVSPCLLRQRRSYVEVVCNTSLKTARATGGDGSVVSCAAMNQADDEGAASEILRRDQRREGEARRWPHLHLS
ncbi:hypothetical protein MnTg02_00488 [bacterium MnTg02]|nr:hypothetical protein MnTg02_00488 [bacterium MnTg02]